MLKTALLLIVLALPCATESEASVPPPECNPCPFFAYDPVIMPV